MRDRTEPARNSRRRAPARAAPEALGRGWVTVALVSGLLASGSPASAQLTAPCELGCGLALGAAGFTVATGTLVAYGRHTGGLSALTEVAGVWAGSFAVFVGSGMALSGNGERQERAVYAAGVGALAGSLVGIAIRASGGESDGPQKVAAALMGAAAGAIVGGVYGAVSHEEQAIAPEATLLTLRIPF